MILFKGNKSRQTDSGKNKLKNDLKKSVPLIAIAVSSVLIIGAVLTMAVSESSANYKQKRMVTNAPAKITVSADLADSLDVLEHKAERADSGKYVLSNDKLISFNEYELMPGVSIDKDPFVRVTGKTEIPSYLYLEVIDTTGKSSDTFDFEIDSTVWQVMSGVSGRNGGTVYVYAPGGVCKLTKANTTGQTGNIDVKILKDDKVTVTANLNVSSNYSQSEIIFFSSMAQAVNDDYQEIYRTQIASHS